MIGYKLEDHFTTACGVALRLNQLPIHFHGMVLTTWKIPNPPPPNTGNFVKTSHLPVKWMFYSFTRVLVNMPLEKKGAGITEG